jgi:hypothetical protein
MLLRYTPSQSSHPVFRRAKATHEELSYALKSHVVAKSYDIRDAAPVSGNQLGRTETDGDSKRVRFHTTGELKVHTVRSTCQPKQVATDLTNYSLFSSASLNMFDKAF